MTRSKKKRLANAARFYAAKDIEVYFNGERFLPYQERAIEAGRNSETLVFEITATMTGKIEIKPAP